MLSKIKENLALVVTGIALLSSVGAGFQAVTSIVSTLTNIDERMYLIEQDFEDLRNETMVSSDIAVLFSRLENLERLADGVSYFEERVIALETNYQNLDRRVSDLTYKVENLEAQFLSDGFGSGGYSLEEWEWLDLQKQLTRIETELDLFGTDDWVLDDLKNRIIWLEANYHGH